MEYLLVMSLSGSMIVGMYLLLKRLLGNKVSARLYYLIARAAIPFYLISLPFLKGWYREIIQAVIPKGQMIGVQIPVRWTNNIIHAGEKVFVNDYAIVQISLAWVWLFVACILIVRCGSLYVRVRHRLLINAGGVMTEKQQSFLEVWKKKYGVRRPVILYRGQEENQTITFGIYSPVIICNREVGSREAELLVRHEMVHIRRLDVLWKLLARFAAILHWWNPAVWILRRELERVCEYSCDEIAMEGEAGEEIKSYLRLLIEEACAVSGRTSSAGWQSSFVDDVESLKERMANLMKKKNWNRYVAGMLVAAMTFGNSMTAFAYRDTLHQSVPGNTSEEEIVKSLQSDTFCFTPDEAQTNAFDPLQGTEVLYEKQFVDTEGNIYPYEDDETVTVYRSCSHDFVSGTASEHTKKSDGGCETRQFRAQRCSKCGYVIKGEEINVITYKVCPH